MGDDRFKPTESAGIAALQQSPGYIVTRMFNLWADRICKITHVLCEHFGGMAAGVFRGMHSVRL
jgi:hypothetical protein